MKNTIKSIIIACFIALNINSFAQKKEFNYFKDTYTEYAVSSTNDQWAKKSDHPVMIMQTERGNFYDNYWHSTVTLIKTDEIVEWLKITKDLFIERDSINTIEDNNKSYSYDLSELDCLKGHKVKLSDNLTDEFTYGVKVSATYMFTYVDKNIKRSTILISFRNTSKDRFVSNVNLSLSARQLDDLIRLLEESK